MGGILIFANTIYLLVIGFHAVVVFGLSKDFLFKFILGRRCESTKVGSTGRDLQIKKVNMNSPRPVL